MNMLLNKNHVPSSTRSFLIQLKKVPFHSSRRGNYVKSVFPEDIPQKFGE